MFFMTMVVVSLPVDGFEALLLEVAVGKREMVIAKEASVGTEGRGMGGLEHEMALAVDERARALGVAAPEDKDETRALGIEMADDGVGELFPALSLMAAGLMGADGERSVEEEDALLGPKAPSNFPLRGGLVATESC